MQSIVSKLVGAGLFVSLLALQPLTLNAADQTPETKKPRGLPYAGKISAVDQSAKTVTLSTKNEKSRVYQIVADTKITLGTGEKATLQDAKVGEEAAVYGHNADGKFVAQSLRIGPKPKKEAQEAKKPKAEEK